MYDWSKAKTTPKPAITGYVFHTCYADKALSILRDGYIRPLGIGTTRERPFIISFTLEPCFNVGFPSVSFVFKEDLIRERYGGVELPMPHYWDRGEEAWQKAWEEEMEVEVPGRVYLTDLVEVLPSRAACWKYGKGYRYSFKDLRERTSGPFRTLLRALKL